MKVDFDTVITTLSGDPMIRTPAGPEAEATPWTLGVVVSDAVLAPPPRDKSYSIGQTTERYALALVAFKGGEAEITAAQAVLIQESAARVLTPLVAGQVIALLDGK